MMIARIGLVVATGMLTATGAFSQNYPTKPVRVIIPISAGSGLDIVGRAISQKPVSYTHLTLPTNREV